MKPIIIMLSVCVFFFALNAFGYSYEKKAFDKHVIHIVKLKAADYRATLVKANNGNGGREAVSAMAQKNSAIVAINSGFFEIGGKRDGNASGSLIINGKIYHIKKSLQPLVIIENGFVSLNQSCPEAFKNQNLSLVSGLPMLIHRGQIPDMLFQKKSAFYTEAHARTALGTDSNKNIIIVVAEHYYAFEEIKGLPILDLARLMKDLDCEEALNLDGGGSSTLWIKDKVVNHTFGDIDEAIGQKIERPVSDAIIFS